MAHPAHDPRSAQQVTRERALGEVSDVLTNLEHTITRARRAVRKMGDDPEERNARLAVVDALTSLEAVRKRLQKDAYFAGGDLRLV